MKNPRHQKRGGKRKQLSNVMLDWYKAAIENREKMYANMFNKFSGSNQNGGN